MIQDELNYTLTDADKEHVVSLCRFKFNDRLEFDIKNILPKSSDSDYGERNVAPYSDCLEDFNNHLRNQFFEDFGGH